MNVNPSLKLPENTCAYERYDPQTLEPVNKETYFRLQELGWSSDDFAGRTVLDIGCNSGLLTLYALRLGAASVHACDVQQALLEFVSQVVKARNLPVKVSEIAFHKLNPEKDQADVVLFMEVLHWAVSQGLQLRSVIQKLAQLTRHILYIEFPWSVREPSIQKQTKLTEESYSADAALDELTRHFRRVRVVRFMRYFGFDSQCQRVLVEAKGKRPETSLLEQVPDVYSLDVPLSRGRNESYLLTSKRGPLVAKLLAPESPFAKLPERLRNKMFDEICATRPTTIVVPEKHRGKYLLPASTQRYWMIFPFIGRLPSAGKVKPFPIDFQGLIDLFIRVRRDFRNISSALLKTLRDQGLTRNVGSVADTNAAWVADPGELANIKEEGINILQPWSNVQPWSNDNKDILDALCHGDLQTGNFVLDDEDVPRVVDLDTLSVGTVYSDGLIGLIWRGAEAAMLAAFCDKLRTEEKRAVSVHDISYAMAIGISWFCAVRRRNANTNIQAQIARLRKGLSEAIQFHSSIGEAT